VDQERQIDPAVSAYFRALAAKLNAKLGKRGRKKSASHAATIRWGRLSKAERSRIMKRRAKVRVANQAKGESHEA
jgi:hypothetical protein